MDVEKSPSIRTALSGQWKLLLAVGQDKQENYASLTCAVDDAMPLTFRDLLQEHFQYSKKTMASVARDEPACDLLF